MSLRSGGQPSVRKRIEELEARLADLPRVIDDDMIFEVLSEPASNLQWVEDVLLEVFRRIGPALKASYEMGVQAWRFCNTRGVVRPRPVGALDRLAWGMSLSHGPKRASFSQPWHLSYKPIEQGEPAFEGLPPPEDWTEVHMRDCLVTFLNLHLTGWEDPLVAIRTSTTGLPIFNSEESGRLLKLIEPLQVSPDPDLPLLVWKDPEHAVHTSWPDGGRQLWTPIDVGLNRPALFLLAHPDQSGDCGDIPVLSNASPAANDVPNKRYTQDAREQPPHLLWKHLTTDASTVSDEGIISRLTKVDVPTLGIGLTTPESFCLAAEEPLRASLLVGAAAYRAQRARGASIPSPTSSVEIVAALLSFESLADMPDDLATKCGWFTPESDHYDFGGNTPRGSPQRRASVEAVALRILLERNRIETLRRHQFNIDDLPTLGNDEGNRLRSLVAPLERDSQGSLPWLVWRDHTGTLQTSRPETGQRWTMVDNDVRYLVEHLFDNRVS